MRTTLSMCLRYSLSLGEETTSTSRQYRKDGLNKFLFPHHIVILSGIGLGSGLESDTLVLGSR